jgi:hypothetical protein
MSNPKSEMQQAKTCVIEADTEWSWGCTVTGDI